MTAVETLKDGIYPGTTRTNYERIEAINYSTLKHFIRSPAHARAYMLHPLEPTEAMDEGTALHTSILEPRRYATDYVTAPSVDRRTKVGKETWTAFEEAHRGKEVLSHDERDTIKAMTDSVLEHETASALLSSPGKNEVAIVWTDKETGLRCKALLDRVTNFAGWTVVVDLKKCRDAAPWAFASQVARLQYHEQSAFYLDGLNALAPLDRRFFWICVEDDRPYAVAVYESGMETLGQGRILYRSHLRSYKRCLETNHWPGYPVGVSPIRLPRWSFTGDFDAS